MNRAVLTVCLLLFQTPLIVTAAEPTVRTPLVGSNQGAEKFEATLVPEAAELVSIEVNVGQKYGGKVVKGVRFTGVKPDGSRVETVVGAGNGTFEKAIEIKPGLELVGISGKHGMVIDSLRFHFSDGTVSPQAGGAGGSEEFLMVVLKKDGKFLGKVRGLHGTATPDSLNGIGLILEGKDGAAPQLDGPEKLDITINGEIDADFAPTLGQLTTLYYESYPALLKRFDNPKKPASRHITLIFKHNMKVPAYCSGSEISISIEWLKKHPEDIALLTHELTHAVQQYPGQAPGWLTEGIADYARHEYGPKNQAGWKLPERFSTRQSYQDGYTTSAKFLVWLETKNPGVIDKLHTKLQNRQFAIGDFQDLTGKTIDELWEECSRSMSKK